MTAVENDLTSPTGPHDATADPGTRNAVTEVVGHTDDFAVGDMKMAKVGERRIAVIRTAGGIHALDNACPHQGYGLVVQSALASQFLEVPDIDRGPLPVHPEQD